MANPAVAAKPAVRVRFYRFRNALREKLAGGQGGAIGLSEEVLAQVQSAMESLAEDYPDWVAKQIVDMRAHHARLIDTPEDRRKTYDLIRCIAQELKGQGATFGYPLVSTFAQSLLDPTAPSAPLTDNNVEIIKAHIDAIAAVMNDRVKGNGGQIGKDLTAQLKAAMEKHSITS
ncbi:MAG TPA: hypothetical protein DCL48_02365 [Alphaproteobacteria bacterium]|nr:hypothetical protein [Alphaproteobacteria bacterium]